MPFRISKEIRDRMRKAERGLSPKVRRARLRELTQYMQWNARRPLRQALRTLQTLSPWRGEVVTEEEFRPSSPNHLYVLAQETREGDFRDYERFLHYLGLDATGDTIVALDERFRIAFNPTGNNRRAWWNEHSHDAYEWLRSQISQKPRLTKDVELNPELIDPKDKHADMRKVIDPDLREFMLQEAVYAALPQRQAEVVWLYAVFHDEDRPRETTKAVAEHLQISPGTVRSHKTEALKNPQLRKMLGW